MIEWAIVQKNQWFPCFLIFGERPERFAYCLWSLIFGEQPEQFAHITHFWWATRAICSHSSLKKREWANRSLKKRSKKYNFSQIFWANCSFFVSERANERFAQKKERFAHLSWTTWANHSRSLISHEQPEQFAHGASFDMSDLSDSPTVTHLSWVI